MAASPTTADLLGALDTLCPLDHAASWDNVGLLVGRSTSCCTKALLCIDLTRAVLDEAIDMGAQAVVSYHPLLFNARKSIADTDPHGALLLSLIEAGIAVVSPHTALDAAVDGLGDWLAHGMGDGSTRPIEHSMEKRASEAVQLMTHVPADRVEEVRDAMASAGAGCIGNYDTCSSILESKGTFRPGTNSNPVVGTHGTIERVDECTLLMVCSTAALPDTIDALRRAHPYTEPPINVVALSPRPLLESGAGRLLMLDQRTNSEAIVDRVKTCLGVDTLRLSIAGTDPHAVVACCPGAGGSMLDSAASQGATLFLTGEMRHHDLLAAQARGVSVLLAGHTNTERGYLPILQTRLQQANPDITFSVSTSDTAPWAAV